MDNAYAKANGNGNDNDQRPTLKPQRLGKG